jgi:release factor glutamine methyltransferase
MMTKIKISEWLIESSKNLAKRSEFPNLESQVILAHVMHQPREWLISHPDEVMNDNQLSQADLQLSRLLKGEPLPYITGHQAFFGLDFMVSPEVLIPRPETEQLVEECIQWLEEHPAKRRVVDVGTGSGIIAITLADRFIDLGMTAVDLSKPALEIAKQNAIRCCVENKIQFIQSDLLEKCEGRFDLIAANLPYIPTKTLSALAVSKYEPSLALDGGEDGLKLISELLRQSKGYINPGGLIILEVESKQSEIVLSMAKSLFPQARNTLLEDLAKLPRIIKIQV